MASIYCETLWMLHHTFGSQGPHLQNKNASLTIYNQKDTEYQHHSPSLSTLGGPSNHLVEEIDTIITVFKMFSHPLFITHFPKQPRELGFIIILFVPLEELRLGEPEWI